jgi:nucleoside-triphosphatase THEP1
MGQVVILTGGRGVGKSTVCREAAALGDQRGYRCRGIITLAYDGVRDVLDVGSGLRRRLTRTAGEGRAVVQGRFRFDPQTLSWGSKALSQATPCDLLLIDEIGPLEVARGGGWVTALDTVRAGGYALAVLVVRPELVAEVLAELADTVPQILTVTLRNRDRLPVRLVNAVERET